MPPWAALSLMLEEDFREAAAPLFASGEVDALEWSFDTGWGRRDGVPAWADALLDHYASEGRLFGHGVHYSPLSARWEERQARWLEGLAREVGRRRYVHVSEHYGFMTAEPFVRGAPLPVPRCQAARRVAHDRLRRMRNVLSCPLGLENLALAWNREEVLEQGPWLDSLLAHEDDFLLLDLHNLYCQVENFDVSADEVLSRMPLGRVREIHISGGSVLPAWPEAQDRVRCDTHDDGVPEPVFALLDDVLERCPRISVVVLERLGGTLRSPADAEGLRRDFERMKRIIGGAGV